MRALAELATAADGVATPAEQLAEAQGIPEHFLKNILRDLRTSGLVTTQRGTDGGYRLARPPERITIADVVRAVSGPLATVRGQRPEELDYDGAAANLTEVWVMLRAEHASRARERDHRLAAQRQAPAPPPTGERAPRRMGVGASAWHLLTSAGARTFGIPEPEGTEPP